MNIDEMKAGPALDQLACEALGTEPKRRGCMCDGQECRSEDYCDAMVYPRVSTDPAAMVAAISRLAWCSIIPPLQGSKLFTVEMEKEVGDGDVSATGETAMEAFARAAAKTKEGL